MKKLFTLFLALAATTSLFAAGTKIGDLYYDLWESDLTATVRYNTSTDANYNYLTTVNIPATITYNNKTYAVTAIGEYAFRNASTITQIVIGDSIKSIGDRAFENCSKLTKVTLKCDKFVSKSFKRDANIGAIFGEQVTDYVIGDGVKTIGTYAFADCANMQRITISNTVTDIKSIAFYACTGLTKVSLPNSVTYVGQEVFRFCDNLTAPVYNKHVYAYMPPKICPESVTIQEGITLIATHAFRDCKALKSVTLPQSLQELGMYAFGICTNLTTINFPNNIRSVGFNAFCESGISTPLYNEYIYAYMPPSLMVASVSIPEGIQVIAGGAFSECTELQNADIPNSVTHINQYAFYNSGLKRVSIGKNVKWFESYTFSNCSRLEEIYNFAVTPQNITASDFGGTNAVDKTKCKLYVPEASVEAYKAANVWKDFGDNIIGMDEGIEEVLANPETNGRKVIIDGQVYILNNGKAFTLQGQELK